MQQELTPDEIAKRQARVAVTTPTQLKAFLAASERRWLVLDALDLVDSLPWPEGVDDLIRVVTCYRNQRQTIETGRYETMETPAGGTAEVPVYKGETLELEELDRCIRFLVAQATEKDPSWSLDNPPL